jgi:hypothetical protein
MQDLTPRVIMTPCIFTYSKKKHSFKVLVSGISVVVNLKYSNDSGLKS